MSLKHKSGSVRDYKVEIDWKKVKHIRPLVEDKVITLDVKPTNNPLPRVMVITSVSDPILFAFCVHSWRNVLYPPELLNWVILDPKSQLTQESFGESLGDYRIRVLTKRGKYYNLVKEIMEMEWLTPPTEETPEENVVSRPLYFTSMDCGDVWFPETLSLKFRALEEGYECVVPDALAYYSLTQNLSVVYKLFLKLPRSGLYWKKRWWESRSSTKMVGVPYLGNCISIGSPAIEGIPQKASVKFYENFPSDVKVMLTKILEYMQSRRDEISDDDESDVR